MTGRGEEKRRRRRDLSWPRYAIQGAGAWRTSLRLVMPERKERREEEKRGPLYASLCLGEGEEKRRDLS